MKWLTSTFDADVVVTTTANRTRELFDAYKSPSIGVEPCAACRCRPYEFGAELRGGRVSWHRHALKRIWMTGSVPTAMHCSP